MNDRGRTSRNYQRVRAQVLTGATVCSICGKPFDPTARPRTPGYPTVDHVIPLSVAPHLAENPANLRPAHWGCNSARHADATLPPRTSRAW